MTATDYSNGSGRRDDGDAVHTSPLTPAEDARTVLINRISWGAVFAGAVLALVIQLVLNMLGIGVGAASLDPASGNNPSAMSFSIGAGIWFAVAGILAALAGGYAAGRLAGAPKASTAAWHGLTAWAVSTLVIFYLLSSTAGSILGGTFSTLGSVVSAVGSTAQTTAQTAAQTAASQPGAGDAFSAIEEAMRGGGAGSTAIAAVRAAITGGQGQTDQAREQAAQSLAQAQNIPVEQARTQVAQYEQQYRQALEQAKQTATEVADATADATAAAALVGAISLILGAIAGWVGGRMGAVDPTMTSAGAALVRRRGAETSDAAYAMRRGADGAERRVT